MLVMSFLRPGVFCLSVGGSRRRGKVWGHIDRVWMPVFLLISNTRLVNLERNFLFELLLFLSIKKD